MFNLGIELGLIIQTNSKLASVELHLIASAVGVSPRFTKVSAIDDAG